MAPRRREKTPHVCANRLCRTPNTPLWRKGWQDPLTGQHVMLCNACGIHYKKNHCCPYCYQVYRESLVDNSGDTWIGCDSCSRWVHLECEALAAGKPVDTHQAYLCPDCKVFHSQTPDQFLSDARKRVAQKAEDNGRGLPSASMSIERSPLKQNKTKKAKERRRPRKIVVHPREDFAADSGSDSSLSPTSASSDYTMTSSSDEFSEDERMKNLNIDLEKARKMLANSFPKQGLNEQNLLKFGSLWAVCEMARLDSV